MPEPAATPTTSLDPARDRGGARPRDRLRDATSNLFIDWMEIYDAKHLNQLPSDDQERCQRAGGDANIHYLQSYWKLDPDEALVIEADRIPDGRDAGTSSSATTGWSPSTIATTAST